MEALYRSDIAEVYADSAPAMDIETAVSTALASRSPQLQERLALLDREDLLTIYTVACGAHRLDAPALFAEALNLDSSEEPAALQARINDGYAGSSLMGLFQDAVAAEDEPDQPHDHPLQTLRAAIAARHFAMQFIERHDYMGLTYYDDSVSRYEYVNGCLATLLVTHHAGIMLLKGRLQAEQDVLEKQMREEAAQIVESARLTADLAMDGARAAAELIRAAQSAAEPAVAVALLEYAAAIHRTMNNLLQGTPYEERPPTAST